MQSRQLEPPVDSNDNELDAGEIIRVWITKDALPTISIDPWIFDENEVAYSRLLCDIAQHEARALELNGQGIASTNFDEIKACVAESLPICHNWPLAPFRNFPMDPDAERTRDLPIPPLASDSDESFEIIRVWLVNPLEESDLRISLSCAENTEQAAQLIVTLVRQIALVLHHKLAIGEDQFFKQLSAELLKELQNPGSFAEGRLV